MKIEEINERRAARRDEAAKLRLEQEAKDLEAIDALEQESGALLVTLSAPSVVAGLPVKIAIRAPSGAEYKRYTDQVSRASDGRNVKARLDAQNLLAESVWVYPAADADTRAKMKEAFPGLLLSIAVEAPKLAELSAEEAGKG